MYVCMYVCMYICMYVLYVCMYVYMYVCIVCMYVIMVCIGIVSIALGSVDSCANLHDYLQVCANSGVFVTSVREKDR